MTLNVNKTSTEMIELIYSAIPATRRSIMNKIMFFIIQSFKQGNVEELNNLLLNLDPNKTLMIVSTGILRITYSHSDKLENWCLFRDKIIAYGKSNALDWEYQLRGLLDNEQKIKNPFASDIDKLIGIHPTLCR